MQDLLSLFMMNAMDQHVVVVDDGCLCLVLRFPIEPANKTRADNGPLLFGDDVALPAEALMGFRTGNRFNGQTQWGSHTQK